MAGYAFGLVLLPKTDFLQRRYGRWRNWWLRDFSRCLCELVGVFVYSTSKFPHLANRRQESRIS